MQLVSVESGISECASEMARQNDATSSLIESATVICRASLSIPASRSIAILIEVRRGTSMQTRHMQR